VGRLLAADAAGTSGDELFGRRVAALTQLAEKASARRLICRDRGSGRRHSGRGRRTLAHDADHESGPRRGDPPAALELLRTIDPDLAAEVERAQS
jgi:hypothetical protein